MTMQMLSHLKQFHIFPDHLKSICHNALLKYLQFYTVQTSLSMAKCCCTEVVVHN